MEKISHLSNTWQQWIETNLAAGCTRASLIESMVRDNFEPGFASQCIDLVSSGGLKSINQPTLAMASAQARATSPFRYEPPRIASQGNAIETSSGAVRLTFRMAQPVVALLDNLLSAQECDELIRLSKLKLARSTIVDPVTGREEIIQERSSDGTFFNLNETSFIAALDKRISEVMNWPVENGEGIQILRYGIGGEYKTHFDYFSPSDPGSQVHLAKGGQRVSTLVMYLSDVQAGGETVFPAVNLSVVPKKGSAVYFEYCNSTGQVDERTLHGGLPVIAGEKWIATKWMRERRYG